MTRSRDSEQPRSLATSKALSAAAGARDKATVERARDGDLRGSHPTRPYAQLPNFITHTPPPPPPPPHQGERNIKQILPKQYPLTI
ncbi:hypothetical protein GHT09_010651 [Marmota monax]|uniref:Uncharacterized protein n=1 Tax=Marmota monax TaxID=9995 RepID=A0A834QEY3_MARMO|nr:hypothetical protein GHT09_010651 [Marmota monax]